MGGGGDSLRYKVTHLHIVITTKGQVIKSDRLYVIDYAKTDMKTQGKSLFSLYL